MCIKSMDYVCSFRVSDFSKLMADLRKYNKYIVETFTLAIELKSM